MLLAVVVVAAIVDIAAFEVLWLDSGNVEQLVGEAAAPAGGT
jgi:hypothetical protein